MSEPAYREAAVIEQPRQQVAQMLENAVAAVAPCRHASTFIRWADLDGSGEVSLKEFQTWWSRKQLDRTDPEAPFQSYVHAATEQAAALWPKFADEDGLLDEIDMGRFLNCFAVAMEWTHDYDKQRRCATFTNKVTQETIVRQPDIVATVEEFLVRHDLVPGRGGTTGRGSRMLTSQEQRQHAAVSGIIDRYMFQLARGPRALICPHVGNATQFQPYSFTALLCWLNIAASSAAEIE